MSWGWLFTSSQSNSAAKQEETARSEQFSPLSLLRNAGCFRDDETALGGALSVICSRRWLCNLAYQIHRIAGKSVVHPTSYIRADATHTVVFCTALNWSIPTCRAISCQGSHDYPVGELEGAQLEGRE